MKKIQDIATKLRLYCLFLCVLYHCLGSVFFRNKQWTTFFNHNILKVTVFGDLFQFRITFGETSNFQETGRKFAFSFPAPQKENSTTCTAI